MTPETLLLQAVRLALGDEPDLVLWRNNTGALRDETGRMVRYGLAVGSPDLVGILAPRGRLFCLEVKTAKGRVSDEQRQWHDLAMRMGAFVRVVRSIDEAREALAEARRAEIP
ncbi:MAG: hypothetical protein RLZZ188_2686 [Verrucomicrobiota bacterium]|jgi:hypothetical protein